METRSTAYEEEKLAVEKEWRILVKANLIEEELTKIDQDKHETSQDLILFWPFLGYSFSPLFE